MVRSREGRREDIEVAALLKPFASDIRATVFAGEETTDKAREELKAVQSIRAEAEEVRMLAQRGLDEVETLQEEAERVMAQARDVFTKAVALNPEAMRSMATTIRTLEEAIRTERHLRQLTRQQAEEEADWARQKATDAILSALSAVRRASNYVSRELEEARRIADTAESLKESSQNDLQRAQAMVAEAEALMRQEARRLLDEPRARRVTPPTETTTPPRPGVEEAPYQPQVREPAARPQPRVSPYPGAEERAYPPGDGHLLQPVFDEAQGEPSGLGRQERSLPRPRAAAGPRPETNTPGLQGRPPIRQDRTSDISTPMGESTEDLESALAEFMRSVENPEATSTREEVREPRETRSEGLFLDDLDFSGKGLAESQTQQTPEERVRPTWDMVGSAQPASGGATEPPAVEAENEFGADLLAYLRESLANAQPLEGATEAPSARVREQRQSPRPPMQPQEGATEAPSARAREQRQSPRPPPAPGPSQSLPAAETYSGILYVIFTPAADAATLSFFWDTIDSIAGVGKVIAQTPLPDGSGHEFTLDLGNDILVLEQLKRRIPGGDIVALGQDRIRIELAPMSE